jgi:hypothetical protein
MGFTDDFVINPQSVDEFARSAKGVDNIQHVLEPLNVWSIDAGMQPLREEEIQKVIEQEAALTERALTR